MEEKFRPKSNKSSRKSIPKYINKATPASKSSKCSPSALKAKMAQLVLKESKNKIPAQIDPVPKPIVLQSHHRRAKSDPVPSSPYTHPKKPVKVTKCLKKPANPPKSSQSSSKSHRRTHSDSDTLKKTASSLLTTATEEQERTDLIHSIKQSFTKGLSFTTTLDFYKLGKPLGKGAFGKVYLGIHKLSGLKVAVKTIEKSFMQDERTRKKVFQEVYIMNKIHDKNVIRLLELFESPKHLMIVLEYAGGGDLLQLLRTRGKLQESEARPIFKQIIDAVQACHKEDIIHRDIKLDNILLNEELTLIKLCDFGVSRVAKRGVKLTEQCGTPAYLAPEIIVNEGYEAFFVDVWSMGILLYALMSATVPFKAKTVPELHKIILRGKYEFPEYFSEETKGFIAEMLNPVPHLRIKLEDLKKHHWFLGEVLENSFHSTSGSVKPGRHAEISKEIEGFGFPRDYVQASLKNREINHATASYNLLDINMLD